MGFDHHAIRAYDMYTRFHKENKMQFNLVVASLSDYQNGDINLAEVDNQIQELKNFCFFQNCGDAVKILEFLESSNMCLDGAHIMSRSSNAVVR